MGEKKNAQLVIDGDASDARAELAKLGREFEKLQGKIKNAGKAGKQSGTDMMPMGKVLKNVIGSVATVGAISGMISKITANISRINEMGSRTVKTDMDLADLFSTSKGDSKQKLDRLNMVKNAAHKITGLGISPEDVRGLMFDALSKTGTDTKEQVKKAIDNAIAATSVQTVGGNATLADVGMGARDKMKAINAVQSSGFNKKGMSIIAKVRAAALESKLTQSEMAEPFAMVAPEAKNKATIAEMGAVIAILSHTKGVKSAEATAQKSTQFYAMAINTAKAKFSKNLKKDGYDTANLQGIDLIKWVSENSENKMMRSKMDSAFGRQWGTVATLAQAYKSGKLQSITSKISNSNTIDLTSQKNFYDKASPAYKYHRESLIAQARKQELEYGYYKKEGADAGSFWDRTMAGFTEAGDGNAWGIIKPSYQSQYDPNNMPDSFVDKFIRGYNKTKDDEYTKNLQAVDVNQKILNSIERQAPR